MAHELSAAQMIENSRRWQARREAERAAARAAAPVKAAPEPRPARRRSSPSAITRQRLSTKAREREAARKLADAESPTLARLRIAKGLTQEALSTASDVPLKTVQDADSGLHRPSLRTRARLAKVLDCNPEALRR